MDPTQNRYWPFDVLPREQQTEQHRREIRFLETAYRAGYRPYIFGSQQDFGATTEERTAEIIYRGCRGKHWEVCLSPFGLSAHLDDFDYAAQAVLCWLRGVEGAEILEHVRGHLFIDRVTVPGFVLHGRDKEKDKRDAARKGDAARSDAEGWMPVEQVGTSATDHFWELGKIQRGEDTKGTFTFLTSPRQ